MNSSSTGGSPASGPARVRERAQLHARRSGAGQTQVSRALATDGRVVADDPARAGRERERGGRPAGAGAELDDLVAAGGEPHERRELRGPRGRGEAEAVPAAARAPVRAQEEHRDRKGERAQGRERLELAPRRAQPLSEGVQGSGSLG